MIIACFRLFCVETKKRQINLNPDYNPDQSWLTIPGIYCAWIFVQYSHLLAFPSTLFLGCCSSLCLLCTGTDLPLRSAGVQENSPQTVLNALNFSWNWSFSSTLTPGAVPKGRNSHSKVTWGWRLILQQSPCTRFLAFKPNFEGVTWS